MNDTLDLLTLPPIVEQVAKTKRYAGVPDLSTLNEQQEQFHKDMLAYLKSSEEGMFLQLGAGGTGKTFLIGKVMESWLQIRPTARIALTAPTNKAVKQLRKASDFTHTNIEYRTIHSLLGLKEQIDKYGKQIFVQDKSKEAGISAIDILVIDETSMLSDDLFLGNYQITGLAEYVRRNGLKVIMMGDAPQIPPVNKDDCIPFTKAGQEKWGIKVVELTHIVRQEAGNPIIETTFKIRENLNRPITFPIQHTNVKDGKGVVFLNRSDKADHEITEKILETYFNSDNFRADADFMKVVCWKNKTVTKMNDWIRSMLYGEESAHRVVVGEKLIANKPIFDGPLIVFNNNDEMEVVEYTVKAEDINKGQFSIKYYDTKVSHIAYETGVEYNTFIKVIHEDSLELYNSILDILVKSAKSHKPGTWEASTAWREYYGFMEVFADVNYNYAITAHKSQGSTYDNCMVLCSDIDDNRKVRERNRIKYTACSRPRSLLFLVH